MSNADQESLAQKLGDEAGQTTWDELHNFMSMVSHDINIVRMEVDNLKTSQTTEIRLLRTEIQSIAPLADAYKSILILFLGLAIGYWLNNRLKRNKQNLPKK